LSRQCAHLTITVSQTERDIGRKSSFFIPLAFDAPVRGVPVGISAPRLVWNNVNTRMAEINNIKTWACANNLALNLTKNVEIVFADSKRRRQVQLPSPLATISRVSSVKVLGVTIRSQMSVSEHVSTVISSCAKSIYALRTLRSHGMNNEALHMIYTSVIRAKLLYAASAWWGLQQLPTVSASRHLSNEASALDCVHGADVSSLAELVDSADDALFQRVLYVQSQPRFTLTVTRSQRNRTLS